VGRPRFDICSVCIQYNGAGEGLVVEDADGMGEGETVPAEGVAVETECEDDD
jgi:hypothetical protein